MAKTKKKKTTLKKKKISKKKPKARKKAKRVKEDWTMKEFVDNVWTTMEKQALENPTIRMVHAKLEPEWNKVIQKVAVILEAPKDNDVSKHIEEICSYGDRAVRPLIDALLRLKSLVNIEEEETKCKGKKNKD